MGERCPGARAATHGRGCLPHPTQPHSEGRGYLHLPDHHLSVPSSANHPAPRPSFSQSMTELGQRSSATHPHLQCLWLLSPGHDCDMDPRGAGWSPSPSLRCLLLQPPAKHNGHLQHHLLPDGRTWLCGGLLHLPGHPHLPGGAPQGQHPGCSARAENGLWSPFRQQSLISCTVVPGASETVSWLTEVCQHPVVLQVATLLPQSKKE